MLDFIMEHIKGSNLNEFIKKKGKLDASQIKFIIKIVLEGLQFLHENGIIHRNINVTYLCKLSLFT